MVDHNISSESPHLAPEAGNSGAPIDDFRDAGDGHRRTSNGREAAAGRMGMSLKDKSKLHKTAAYGSPKEVERLLDEGADPLQPRNGIFGAREKRGNTPVHEAARKGRFQNVRVLVDRIRTKPDAKIPANLQGKYPAGMIPPDEEIGALNGWRLRHKLANRKHKLTEWTAATFHQMQIDVREAAGDPAILIGIEEKLLKKRRLPLYEYLDDDGNSIDSPKSIRPQTLSDMPGETIRNILVMNPKAAPSLRLGTSDGVYGLIGVEWRGASDLQQGVESCLAELGRWNPWWGEFSDQAKSRIGVVLNAITTLDDPARAAILQGFKTAFPTLPFDAAKCAAMELMAHAKRWNDPAFSEQALGLILEVSPFGAEWDACPFGPRLYAVMGWPKLDMSDSEEIHSGGYWRAREHDRYGIYQVQARRMDWSLPMSAQDLDPAARRRLLERAVPLLPQTMTASLERWSDSIRQAFGMLCDLREVPKPKLPEASERWIAAAITRTWASDRLKTIHQWETAVCKVLGWVDPNYPARRGTIQSLPSDLRQTMLRSFVPVFKNSRAIESSIPRILLEIAALSHDEAFTADLMTEVFATPGIAGLRTKKALLSEMVDGPYIGLGALSTELKQGTLQRWRGIWLENRPQETPESDNDDYWAGERLRFIDEITAALGSA